MKAKILAICFAIPFVCLVIWTITLTWQRNHGSEVKVAVMGYDPRDLLSGHYIQYRIDWTHTDCSQFKGNQCPEQDFCKDARWGRQCRFYIPENKARDLDKLFRKRNDTDTKFEVVYSYQPGRKVIAKQLLINGKDWRESVAQQEKEGTI